MLTLVRQLHAAAQAHARYRQTRRAIARLPLDVALDLALYPGDADRIARLAVYGSSA